ncbi:patatin-like phospholipase RssA [Guyparkeria sp. SCN-R1]|uniref:patatin-like phospholipase RssA n=1 Tax=Guyparkeria sp. SCN-R1 TaxID=2341113 RepID=UPI000F6546E6|nr:patatin-like phospholipase RssA [Guyparkeria sp. SCN-R1]RRQ24234.1 patatin-like phospholipase RssA [Guyparkeria sp. SCN-R1]
MTDGKPTIGLALGSGAARGWAHIGVVKALEEAGIRPTVVAGCSFGALIGAGYAGESMDKLEAWARSIRSWDVMRLLDVRLGGGLIEGDDLMRSLAKQVEPVDIEKLRIPFAAVATDLEAGREVWLREGSLIDAVHASIAVPGLMSPVRNEGRWLVDGGLTDPVPVSLCRALGADVVIAVNLNSDLVGRHVRDIRGAARHDTDNESGLRKWVDGLDERLLDGRIGKWLEEREKAEPTPGMLDVMAGAINIMQDRITRSRMAGDPPELMVSPKLSHIGLLEFERADEAIEKGYEAARRALDDSALIVEIGDKNRS